MWGWTNMMDGGRDQGGFCSASRVRNQGEDPTFQNFIHSTTIPECQGLGVANVSCLLVLKIERKKTPTHHEASRVLIELVQSYSEAQEREGF